MSYEIDHGVTFQRKSTAAIGNVNVEDFMRPTAIMEGEERRSIRNHFQDLQANGHSGPVLEQLITQLMQESNERSVQEETDIAREKGPPPASKEWIETLPVVKSSDACAICLDVNSEIQLQLPTCRHIFHKTCVVPWLEVHSMNN
jgi:hypothetical protein